MDRRDFFRKTMVTGLATAGAGSLPGSGNMLMGNHDSLQGSRSYQHADNAYGDVDIHDPRTQIPEGLPPLIDGWMRDPVIMGLVWNLDDGPEWIRNFHVHYPDGGKIVPPEKFYQNRPAEDIPVRRSLWSPRITYSAKYDTYLASGSMSFNMGIPTGRWITGIFGGTFVLRSLSGEAEGPYQITSERPLTYFIDCRIFEDDDQTLYFIWQDGRVAKLNEELNGIYEYHAVWQQEFDPEPTKEGVHIFKHNGLYHLVVSMFSHEINGKTTYRHEGHGGPGARTYDAVVATSENIYGPYGRRYTSITDGGHGNHFRDCSGNWRACVFHDDDDHNNENGMKITPRMVPMHWVDGKIFPGISLQRNP